MHKVNRHLVFKHYWWLAILGWLVCIAIVFVSTTTDRTPLIGSAAAAWLTFCYFVQQQKLAETSLFKELFIEFNRRYDVLNDRLYEIVEAGDIRDRQDRQTIVDYINLCAEEYLFFSEGYIHPEVWQSWCAGMLCYFDREPFKSVWDQEMTTSSYYGLSIDEVRRGSQRGQQARSGFVAASSRVAPRPSEAELKA